MRMKVKNLVALDKLMRDAGGMLEVEVNGESMWDPDKDGIYLYDAEVRYGPTEWVNVDGPITLDIEDLKNYVGQIQVLLSEREVM